MVATVYLLLVMVETIQRDDPDLLWGRALGVPLAVGTLATGFGLDEAAVGPAADPRRRAVRRRRRALARGGAPAGQAPR